MKAFTVEFKGLIPMTWNTEGEETGPVLRWHMWGECLEGDCDETRQFEIHPTVAEVLKTKPARLESYIELAPGLTPDQVRATLVRNIDEFLKLMLEHNEEEHKEEKG